jgi:DNA-binding MarR family transcriptional regulator
MERTLGITGPQRLVIRLLGRFPGLTLARVAGLLEVHPSTASVVVKRLEGRGLVHRRADTRDRRRAYLGLTEAGRRLDTETEGTVEAAVDRTLAGLPRPSIDGARAVLETLARELGGGAPGDDGRR